jgi:hypothetical protein
MPGWAAPTDPPAAGAGPSSTDTRFAGRPYRREPM